MENIDREYISEILDDVIDDNQSYTVLNNGSSVAVIIPYTQWREYLNVLQSN